MVELRSLAGPPPVNVGRIAHPPVVTLDLGSNGVAGNYVQSVVRIPDGFRDEPYAGGLAVAFKYGGESLDWSGEAPDGNTGASYLGLHRRAASTRMGAGWAVVEGSYMPQAGWVHMAAQRRGEYLYAVTAGNNPSGNLETAFGVRCPTLSFSETRHWQACPIYENDGESSITFGAVHSMWQAHPNFEMHVSDHENPFIWFLQGHQAMLVQDSGVPWSYQYKTEQSVLSDVYPYHPYYTYSWQMPAYFQAYYNRVNFLLPTLVFPWSAGDYGTPEMWWFERETYQGEFTGRLTIYRSRWAAGNFRAKAGLARSSHNTVVGGFNAEQAAFDHFWYKSTNIVGTVGPFPGINPKTNDLSGYVPRVIRSTKNRDVLQFALLTVDSTLPGGWDGVWLAHSEDDGAHWSHPRQVSPGAAGDVHTVVGPPGSGTLEIAMDSFGGIWSPITFTRNSKDAQALANWVRGTGLGNVDGRNQNWRRPYGAQWL